MKIGKYEFNSKEQAKSKIEALSPSTEDSSSTSPLHNHCVVELGYIVLERGSYDADGNEITAPVLSEKYHVDVMWDNLDGHPYGWATYDADVDGEGSHGFMGVSYQSNKM